MAARGIARVVVIVSVVAACGGEPAADEIAADSAAVETAAPVDAGIKACDVITVAELEAVLDLDLGPGRTTNDYAGDSKCQWDLAGDARHGVSISLRRLADLELYRNVPGGIDAPNLGDEAIWNATYGQLAVLQQGQVVSIALLVPEPRREDAEEIARLALARISGQARATPSPVSRRPAAAAPRAAPA